MACHSTEERRDCACHLLITMILNPINRQSRSVLWHFSFSSPSFVCCCRSWKPQCCVLIQAILERPSTLDLDVIAAPVTDLLVVRYLLLSAARTTLRSTTEEAKRGIERNGKPARPNSTRGSFDASATPTATCTEQPNMNSPYRPEQSDGSPFSCSAGDPKKHSWPVRGVLNPRTQT